MWPSSARHEPSPGTDIFHPTSHLSSVCCCSPIYSPSPNYTAATAKRSPIFRTFFSGTVKSETYTHKKDRVPLMWEKYVSRVWLLFFVCPQCRFFSLFLFLFSFHKAPRCYLFAGGEKEKQKRNWRYRETKFMGDNHGQPFWWWYIGILFYWPFFFLKVK